MIFEINIKNGVATHNQSADQLPVCGNSVHSVVFEFDEEWDGHEKKTARFKWGGKHKDVEFTGNTCEVPIVKNTQSVLVGVYVGEEPDDEVVLSSTDAVIKYQTSTRCGSTTPNPSSGANYTNEARGYAAAAASSEEYVRGEAEKLADFERVTFEKARVYGVDGVGKPTPALTRTDDAVGLSVSIGESEITSDFSKCYPWSDICEITDTAGNVFVKIPKFYTKVTKNENGTYKYQISGVRHVGFSTLFIDGKGDEIDYVLVGKYEASGSASKVYSKSGKTVLVGVIMNTFRTGCAAHGTGYQQYDFLIDWIIKYLFMVEFATTDCQTIMRGWTDFSNTAALSTGKTDSVKTMSGSPTSNTSGFYACKYRGIENPWGNVWKFCDGISFYQNKIYLCTDPTQYKAGKNSAPYFYVGDKVGVNGTISSIGHFETMPLLGYANGTTAGNGYYGDYHTDNGGGFVAILGGRWDNNKKSGLFCVYASHGVNIANAYTSSRLCYKPIKGGVLNG